MAGDPCPEFDWRIDIDALVFLHQGSACRGFVHRLAFRSLTGKTSPSPRDCMDWFGRHHPAFLLAADRKLKRGKPAGNTFSLTSRDIRRALEAVSDIPDISDVRRKMP